MGPREPGDGQVQKNKSNISLLSSGWETFPSLESWETGSRQPPLYTSTNKIQQFLLRKVCCYSCCDHPTTAHNIALITCKHSTCVKKPTYFTNYCLWGPEKAMCCQVLCTGLVHSAFAASFHPALMGTMLP